MKSAPSPFGSCKVLALYKQVVVLHEIYAYLIVAEAVNHRNEESLKRGGKTELKLFWCAFCCVVINISRQSGEEHSLQ